MKTLHIHQKALASLAGTITLTRYFFLVLVYICSASIQAQDNRIAKEIAKHDAIFESLRPITPFVQSIDRKVSMDMANEVVQEAIFFDIHASVVQEIVQKGSEFLSLEIPFEGNTSKKLRLKRADVFTASFQVFTSDDPGVPYPYEKGQYYWGVIEGEASSLAALAITRDEIMGFIQFGKRHFTLGKLEGDADHTHILYETNKLDVDPGLNCYFDESQLMGDDTEHQLHSRDASNWYYDNCVLMYIEVDYDIYVDKGGVQQAADYVIGAFSQVVMMYENEGIDMPVIEIVVWNTVDPYTGPTPGDYVTQFKTYLNENFYGDLAHLVGYNGGGGAASGGIFGCYRNGDRGVAYSAVHSTYQNVPAYSWTVTVMTHEIGHNLGSPHTHSCAWNGNNTAIDGCGPAAGYSEGCDAPLPESGTVMSYCHLIEGVGIDLANGFGPQPGDRIRSNVYSSECLAPCGPPAQYDAGITAIHAPIPFPCEATTAPSVTLMNFGEVTLTGVTIQYQLDNGTVQNYEWSGNLSYYESTNVTLPDITYGTGPHTFVVIAVNPNGQSDEFPYNDAAYSSFTYHVDWCTCNAVTGDISPNPLTHAGSGSSNASINLGANSKRPQFTISNLNSRNRGSNHLNFIDRVIVTYVDAYGANKTYGTFYGNQQSSVNVNIHDMVNSISINLSNSLNNEYSGTLSVSFSAVSFCSGAPGCPDADGDSVCDTDDVCPGFDDNLIGDPCDDSDPCTENDVYTLNCICEGTVIEGCQGGCDEVTDHFSPNPLTHTGAGSSQSDVTLAAYNTDVAFTISGLGSLTNGNPNNRYIERVTVNYVNGSGATVLYGEFRGDQVSTVNVSIGEEVQSVTLTLDDAYDGNSSTQMSVSMTDVTSCANGGALIGTSGDEAAGEVLLYPNPTNGDLFVQWENAPAHATISIYNVLGQSIGSVVVEEVKVARVSLKSYGISGSELLFVSIDADGHRYGMRKVMVKQ